MDQSLSWWTTSVLGGWRERSGPAYQRLAESIADAIEHGTLRAGMQVPAERALAQALGVSRGTVVTALDTLTAAGFVRRRQGAGTFVSRRPGWAEQPATDSTAALLVRRAAHAVTVDMSLSVPPGTSHLPPVDWSAAVAVPSGPGLDPQGALQLRAVVADHLTRHQGLPSDPDQIVITAGAQQALSLIAAVLGPAPTTVITGCPTYPGLRGAFAGRRAALVAIDADSEAGIDPDSVRRAVRRADRPVLYVMSTGSNPTGSLMPPARAEAILDAARSRRALVVEDLALADVVFDGARPVPLASLDPEVIAVGSTSKVLWAGLRIGWVRANEPLRSRLLAAKSAMDLATGSTGQQVAAALLAGIDNEWRDRMHAALRRRRDHLEGELRSRLPSWRLSFPPRAGLSLWMRLPVAESDTFAHQAAMYGAPVAPGSLMCHCGRHLSCVRLSLAHPLEALSIGAQRLESAWEAYSADIAATPATKG